MTGTTNILLILRSGDDFKLQDVYLLASHINKYWQSHNRPKIYCFTDLVNKKLEVVGLTLLPFPSGNWQGWWSKMNLFSPEIKNLRPFLYFDLDTAILGDVKKLVPIDSDQNKFITLQDFYRPNRLASGVMWVPNTAYMDKIYANWIKDPVAIMKKFRGDQDFIESVVKADLFYQSVLKENTVVSYKPRINGRIEHRIKFPVNSTVVCFHGKPRIGEAASSVEWVKAYVNYEI